MRILTLGIELAKDVFALLGVAERHRASRDCAEAVPAVAGGLVHPGRARAYNRSHARVAIEAVGAASTGSRHAETWHAALPTHASPEVSC